MDGNSTYKNLSLIYNGVSTVIYRGMQPDGTSVILKTLKAEYPTLEEITRLKHEYKILESLEIAGAVKALALENYQNGSVLILEDFSSISLKQLIGEKKIEVLKFLDLACQLAKALHELHKNGIVHKDIKPQNILVDPNKWQVKITDFSISTRLSRETQSVSNPNLIEGTLAYMSPEQTGRMNRSIDYRTDFYSLGVTFYEMLTGELPFKSNEAIELVHSHVALKPVSPKKLNPEIPLAVSAVVMKLLAKNAEDRYQSGYGLLADLEQCQAQLQAKGFIEDFTPGQRDKAGKFLIPQKLYGREVEVAALLEAFDRVCTEKSEMMLVSGYSGIGKTSVVNEVHKPIVRERGYFIAGKFDQFKRNIPYAAIIQAFSELVGQLLTESEVQIQSWKSKIIEAVGSNGKVIIDVIPEVELIVGSQIEVPQLGPIETQNRFNRVFKQFLTVFTKKEHPLVIFLDDLQWADSASLKLIELLITDPESQYLLLIGAYRDNEVNFNHPLMLTLEEIQKAGARVNNIVLKPLELSHVICLLTETINEAQESNLLAELAFNKTGGNPFFLTQLLQTLYSEKLLEFDFRSGEWQWDVKEIQAIGITDFNVVELIARNIQKLSSETQEILKLAACIGNSFNLNVLATVSEKSLLSAASDLWEALQAGLILPTSNTYKIPLFIDANLQAKVKAEDVRIGYKFLHDRVQQAAYSLIPEPEKKALHLKIGQLLLQSTPDESLELNIFDIVNQLNFGLDTLNRLQKDELARLNYIAGCKAKAATAYEAAFKYLQVSIELLNKDSWQTNYDFSRNLYIEATESAYLVGDFEQMEKLAENVTNKANSELDKVKIYEIRIHACFARRELSEAIEIGLQILEILGVKLTKEPTDAEIDRAFAETAALLNQQGIEELLNLPDMTDLKSLAILEILNALGPPTYIVGSPLFPLIVLSIVNLSIAQGLAPLSAYGYATYGLIMCSKFNEIELGYQFGQLALNILSKFSEKKYNSEVLFIVGNFIVLWKCHLKESIGLIQLACQSGLETGDLVHFAWSYQDEGVMLYWMGQELTTLERQVVAQSHAIAQTKVELASNYNAILRQVIINLLGRSTEPCRLVGEAYNEDYWLPQFQKVNNGHALGFLLSPKLTLDYLFENYDRALETANLLAKYIDAVAGHGFIPLFHFYDSLTQLALYGSVSETERKSFLERVKINQEKMQQWAKHAPMNYLHKFDLVEGERYRVSGDNYRAMDYYDRAIVGAKENGYIQEEALANEIAAKFYLEIGKEKIAKTYMTEAYYGYIRWGAVAKVKDLDKRYPQLIFRTPKQEIIDIDTTQLTTTTMGKDSRLLDISTVVKASQAISGEILLSSLLDKLMKIAIENAGATRGCLLAKQDEQWIISIEGVASDDRVEVRDSFSTSAAKNFPVTLINYVERTQINLVLDSAASEQKFADDSYIATNCPRSILCLPILYQRKLTGILYLENNQTNAAFTAARVEMLKLLTAQASISIENARLYAREQKKSRQLEESFHKLQQTQAQLVQTEKISSLGQLVAGVAHEVNNPVSFINGNLHHACGYVEDLLDLLQLYQQEYPEASLKIQNKTEEIELDYLVEDLPKMLSSMQVGTDRIKDIMQSLRTFSRVDEVEKKPADIHAGIDSTLMILQHRLKANGERPAIEVVKKYGNLPLVECYAGQLNQVFMNIIANAIDALEEYSSKRTKTELERNKLAIAIRTEVIKGDKVAIAIADNGLGISEKVQQKLFAPFFTTKPAGKGTGLGLSISYQIIVEKHGGSLRCNSAPLLGTEFVIEIPSKQFETRNN